MTLSWVACDFTTGTVLADLTDLTPQSALRQTIGQYETNTLTVPLVQQNGSPLVDWLTYTKPYAVNLIALDENNNPVWGGPIIQRPRTEGDTLVLPVATGEAYFDRCYISPSVSSTVITTPTYGYYASWDQCALGGDLVTRYVAGVKAGINGMPVRVAAGTSSQAGRTQIYSDADDKTVYGGMQELSAILNGPEWTLSWEWQHAPERITPVFTIADRLGQAVTPGLNPAATFSMPGPASAVTYLEDYSAGKGANIVTAVGSGQGNSRPSAQVVSSNANGRPHIEYRFNVPTVGQLTVAQIQALTGYAARALGFIGDGFKTITLAANVQKAPVFGVDWHLGDDIGYEIGGLDVNGNDIAPAFPGGMSGTARCIGVERTDTTVSPIILVPNPFATAGSF